MFPRLALATLTAAVFCASAQPNDRAQMRIEKEVRKQILKLPFYGIFDWITFRVDGYKVTLMGHVSRPTLKTDSERVVKKIEGVEGVDNRIEVLPLSPNDDRLRQALYVNIFGHNALRRYRIRGPNAPIHILVNNGNVTLEGVVNQELEKTVAGTQANATAGVFSVTNNLAVEKRKK